MSGSKWERISEEGGKMVGTEEWAVQIHHLSHYLLVMRGLSQVSSVFHVVAWVGKVQECQYGLGWKRQVLEHAWNAVEPRKVSYRLMRSATAVPWDHSGEILCGMGIETWFSGEFPSINGSDFLSLLIWSFLLPSRSQPLLLFLSDPLTL